MAYKRRKGYNRGQWAVQRERFHLGEAAPPPPFDVAQPFGDLLQAFCKKYKLADQVCWQRLQERWAELMGPQVAAHARPGHMDRKTLVVYVRHPMWIMELRGFGEKEILARAQQAMGADHVTGLRLMLDPDPPAPAAPKRTAPQ